MKPSEPVIGSYVHHKGKCWNVSTIHRQGGSPYFGGMYYETLVWDYDTSTRQRGEIVHQDEGINAHFDVCKKIVLNGAFWEAE